MTCYDGWVLAGDPILEPLKKTVTRSAMAVTNRTLSGSNRRDFIGSEKKIITIQYEYATQAELDVIFTHWEDQQQNGTSKLLTVTKTGFTFSGNVLIDISTIDMPARLTYDYQAVTVTFTEI
jgi:hypothetical protein